MNEWNISQVKEWFSSIGYTDFGIICERENVDGKVICSSANFEFMQALGITNLSLKVDLLSVIYKQMLNQGIECDPEELEHFCLVLGLLKKRQEIDGKISKLHLILNSSASGATSPTSPTQLTAKQNQILKSAMELYGEREK